MHSTAVAVHCAGCRCTLTRQHLPNAASPSCLIPCGLVLQLHSWCESNAEEQPLLSEMLELLPGALKGPTVVTLCTVVMLRCGAVAESGSARGEWKAQLSCGWPVGRIGGQGGWRGGGEGRKVTKLWIDMDRFAKEPWAG